MLKRTWVLLKDLLESPMLGNGLVYEKNSISEGLALDKDLS